MNSLAKLATVAGLILTAHPVSAGTPVPSGGLLIDGVAVCPEQARRESLQAPRLVELVYVVMDKDSTNAVSVAHFQEYLDFHVQAQQATGGRAPLMPWSELRPHAN